MSDYMDTPEGLRAAEQWHKLRKAEGVKSGQRPDGYWLKHTETNAIVARAWRPLSIEPKYCIQIGNGPEIAISEGLYNDTVLAEAKERYNEEKARTDALVAKLLGEDEENQGPKNP